MNLAVGVSATDLLALAKALVASGRFGSGEPTRVTVDHREKKPSTAWIDDWAHKVRTEYTAYWNRAFISVDKGIIVKAKTQVERIRAADVLSMLSALPFDLASFDSVHEEWFDAADRYFAPGFGNLHWPHGWACAFKGAGHARLVSRRWLDFGPWLVRRGDNDTTLVQFHDLEADAATALEQARAGHEAMGISMNGGFLQWPGYVMRHDIGGLYIPASRELRVIVHGRDVPESEMTDAAATRAFRLLGDDKPIDKVSYVFMDEAAARKHLHALWLRDIAVHALVRGVETRLDVGYTPAPQKPDWVLRVLDRERQ